MRGINKKKKRVTASASRFKKKKNIVKGKRAKKKISSMGK